MRLCAEKKGIALHDGYLESFVINRGNTLARPGAISIATKLQQPPMPENSFEGSMVGTMSLSSNGECLGGDGNQDPVCVKSDIHASYQFTEMDGSIWQANCTTTH